MSEALFLTGSALRQIGRAVEARAHNVANGDTTGFQARRVAFVAKGRSNFAQAVAYLATDEAPVLPDGDPLHVALPTGSFLRVLGPDGDAYLSRAGDLRPAADGTLVDGHGLPVLVDGRPLVLGAGAVSVAADGSVVQAGRYLGRLDVVRTTRVAPLGVGALYRATGTVVPTRERLEVGALAGANVDVHVELTELIQDQRQYGQLARLLRMFDELDRDAASALSVR